MRKLLELLEMRDKDINKSSIPSSGVIEHFLQFKKYFSLLLSHMFLSFVYRYFFGLNKFKGVRNSIKIKI